MGSVPISRLLTLAAIGAVVAVCANAVTARPERAEPFAVLTDATGDLSIWNSLDGQAVFQFSGLAPGHSVSGTVQLKNTGSLPGDLGLEQLDVHDQPGANGGRLSDAVRLDITDVTSGNSIPVFAGQIGALATQPLGAIGPGEGRTFHFRASLPDTGPPPSPTGGDNAFAGSGLTMRYAWNATTSGSIGPSGPGGPAGGRGGGNGGGPGPITENRPWVKYRVNARKLLKRGWLDVLARCNRGCTLTVTAKAPKKTRIKIRRRIATLPLPNKTARIRLKLNRKSRRALTRALRGKKRVVLQVQVKLVAAGWGEVIASKKKVAVKRPKRSRR
jgi:spore coat-associated protein N